ncbi:MFS transporter [Candidatus Woesearchaeota archaeon]|nr:MFS transporter [Candidatus Woesearchaeota archaeon]
MSNLNSNIWKYFFFLFTQRRNFMTILSIYFLTLPNTTAQQIGFYTAIGNLAGFLLEIPSGYLSDRLGHKFTLVLAKVSLFFSTFCFIFFQTFYGFILGSILLTISTAFVSGTISAFMHDTLHSLGREKDFSKITGKTKANVSLLSVFFIIGLPFFTTINIILPLIISLVLDIFGLLISLILVTPKEETTEQEKKQKTISQILRETKSLNFFPFALFTGTVLGFSLGDVFKYVYLESLSYPVLYVGFVMGLSRLVWFLIGNAIPFIEKHVSIKQLLLFETVFFPLSLFLIAYTNNPWFAAALFIVKAGYVFGRGPIFEQYILTNYLSDKRYKATLLSLQNQISFLFQVLVPFLIAYIVSYSFKLGYYAMSFSLFCILASSLLFILRSLGEKPAAAP